MQEARLEFPVSLQVFIASYIASECDRQTDKWCAQLYGSSVRQEGIIRLYIACLLMSSYTVLIYEVNLLCSTTT